MIKQYYFESDRIVSKIGGGMENLNYNIYGHVYAFDIQNESDYENKILRNDTMMYRNIDSVNVSDEVLMSADFKRIGTFRNYNVTENDIYFYHKDHLGSSTQITDREATVIHHIEYMPSGEQFAEQRSTWGTNYKFNSKELDAETGLYYYGARYYSPALSIWASVDPKSDDYPHQSPFMFCSGNPVVRVDMNGMEDDIFIVIKSESSDVYVAQLKNAKEITNYLYNSGVGQEMINQYIDNDKQDLYVTIGNTTPENAVGTTLENANANTKKIEGTNFGIIDVSKHKSAETLKNFNGLVVNTNKKNTLMTLDQSLFSSDNKNNRAGAKILGHEIGAHANGMGHEKWGQTGQNDFPMKNSPAYNLEKQINFLNKSAKDGPLQFQRSSSFNPNTYKLTR